VPILEVLDCDIGIGFSSSAPGRKETLRSGGFILKVEILAVGGINETLF
jgi:hypothetical protein